MSYMDGIEIEQGRWDEEESTGTYCPDCGVIIGPEEDGFEYEECIECGSPDVFQVPY